MEWRLHQSAQVELTLGAGLEIAASDAVLATVRRLVGDDVRPRPRTVRVQPSVCLWATYGGDGRWATLKVFFRRTDFDGYAEQLAHHYPHLLATEQVSIMRAGNAVAWAFPFDPVMPGLAGCLDTGVIADAIGRIPPLLGVPQQYRPEVGALIAYATAADQAPVAFGKVLPTATIGVVHAAARRLWDSEARRSGMLCMPRPLAYRPDLGLLLEAAVVGETIGRDRNRVIFRQLVRHAGAALAGVHAADAPFGFRRGLDQLIARLEEGLKDVALLAPRLLRSARHLVSQLDRRQGGFTDWHVVPSHGDFKYDQFLEHMGAFTLIDFELFCQADPALDLGTFCAYLPNSTPRDWRESAAAELLRTDFLASYRAASGNEIDADRLAAYEAAMLGVRALSHVWTRQRNWELRASQLLDLALERLLNRAPGSASSARISSDTP